MSLPSRSLLDLRSVEQGGDNSRGADSHGNSGLHQLAAALFVGAVDVVVTVVHGRSSMAFGAALEAA